jgi:hypothetical protein
MTEFDQIQAANLQRIRTWAVESAMALHEDYFTSDAAIVATAKLFEAYVLGLDSPTVAAQPEVPNIPVRGLVDTGLQVSSKWQEWLRQSSKF